MPESVIAHAGFALVVLVAIVGFLKGDEPERIGAGAYALALFSTLLLREESLMDQPQLALILIDAALLVVYGALAWKSRRAWPAWAAAVQTVAVMAHVLMIAQPGASIATLYEVVSLANFAALGVLSIGVFQAWRDRAIVAEPR
ncbi:hypothetical protein [Brevundimonas sp. Root1279]|uniref:hypothetical protein n=1 Tax=Brevundimonas sp. Root1279 TaxID=1736443 RepID=UPI0006F4F4A0|nr:hypothetical protein [Brevundimonas sp. Root1279]KQW79640.1 hypothetical protein ASC65_13870 [Brevundimonas sp. Root1279]